MSKGSGRSGIGDLDLTAEQVQLFERGNQNMLKHYETTLDKVRYAYKFPPRILNIDANKKGLLSNHSLKSRSCRLCWSAT